MPRSRMFTLSWGCHSPAPARATGQSPTAGPAALGCAKVLLAAAATASSPPRLVVAGALGAQRPEHSGRASLRSRRLSMTRRFRQPTGGPHARIPAPAGPSCALARRSHWFGRTVLACPPGWLSRRPRGPMPQAPSAGFQPRLPGLTKGPSRPLRVQFDPGLTATPASAPLLAGWWRLQPSRFPSLRPWGGADSWLGASPFDDVRSCHHKLTPELQEGAWRCNKVWAGAKSQNAVDCPAEYYTSQLARSVGVIGLCHPITWITTSQKCTRRTLHAGRRVPCAARRPAPVRPGSPLVQHRKCELSWHLKASWLHTAHLNAAPAGLAHVGTTVKRPAVGLV
jgi:hypothetical protein